VDSQGAGLPLTKLVLDSSVVWYWFQPAVTVQSEAAAVLASDLQGSALDVWAPPLLWTELINIAGRRHKWGPEQLRQLAGDLERLAIEVRNPSIHSVAVWAGRGLSAYDATYVALAETLGAPLITDDREILVKAPGIAQPLVRA
jgi:predicted nucleic acid-binding protein